MPKITDLTEAFSVADDDYLYAVVGSNSRKVRKDTLMPAASSVKLQTEVAASGQTSIDFAGVPAWANRISVNFDGLSTNGTSPVQIQIGDASGFETSGYLGSSSAIGASVGTVNHAAGFLISCGGSAAATNVRHGTVFLSRSSGNKWAVSGTVGLSEIAVTSTLGGTKALSDVLTQVRVTTVNGTDTFDAGSVSVSWE